MKAGKVHYEIVDSSFQGKTKGQLYSMSKLWLFDQHLDMTRYIEIDNPDEGLIAGRGTLPSSIGFKLKGTYTCSFSFLVISKNGRYKAQLYDFWLTYTGTDQSIRFEYFLAHPETYIDYKNVLPKLEGQAYDFIRSIQYAMQAVYDVMDF